MVTLQSKWRYLVMLLAVQLVVMALLSREGNQRRVSYFFRIFRKTEHTASPPHGHNGTSGGDVYANLSAPARSAAREDLPYCPRKSPLIGEFNSTSHPYVWALSVTQVRVSTPILSDLKLSLLSFLSHPGVLVSLIFRVCPGPCVILDRQTWLPLPIPGTPFSCCLGFSVPIE